MNVVLLNINENSFVDFPNFYMYNTPLRGDCMLYLKDKPYDEVGSKIRHMMENETGIKEIFGNKISRLISSPISMLIMEDLNPIGFINLVNENIEDLLFLDMGIIEKYRGQGYGTKAIQTLIEISDGYIWEFIIGKTKKTNIFANAMASTNAALVYSTEEGFNYYIFPASRKEEFENSDIFDVFKDHCDNVPTKKKVINQYYN